MVNLKLSELEDMLEKDLKWDLSDLAREACKSSDLFVKYIKLWSNEKLTKELMENNFEVLLQEKRDYYSGNASAAVYKAKPFGVKLRASDVNKYMAGDVEIVRGREKILIQEQKVEILSAVLKEIDRRGYAIKNAIDYTKYMAGG